MVWYIWAILGVFAIVFEIASPTFFAGFIGVGFLSSAVVAYFAEDALILQILIAIGGMFLGAFIVKYKKIAEKSPSKLGQSDEFIGIQGKVEESLRDETQGKVKLIRPVLGNSLWMAISHDGSEILHGTRIEIVAIHGSYLVVKPII